MSPRTLVLWVVVVFAADAAAHAAPARPPAKAGARGGAKGGAKAPRRKPPLQAPAPVPVPVPVPAPAPAVSEPPSQPALPPPPPEPPAAPAPAPEAARAPSAAPSAGAARKIEALQAEYASLKDALFRSRARREALESALLSTQLVAKLRWEGSRHHLLKNVEVRLDGLRLWESGETPPSDKPVSLEPKSVPPGPHVLGVRIAVQARDDAKIGYVSDQSFAVTLAEGKKTTVEITIDEDGDLPSYNPDVDIAVEVD